MRCVFCCIAAVAIFVLFTSTGPGICAPDTSTKDILTVSGTISNAHGKPVKGAEISVYANGQELEPQDRATTSKEGKYEVEVVFPCLTIGEVRVQLEATKPSYASSGRMTVDGVLKGKTDEQGNTYYLARQDFQLARSFTPAFWIASFVLVAVYILIAFELMHRTLAALLGASLLLFVSYTAGAFDPDYVILSFEEAVGSIDMNVIFLLMAMMIIVGVLKKTGVFQWMAYKSYQLAGGNVFALASMLMFVTAVISAFLDNVTTMLLIIPVTVEIAETLGVNPVAFLIPEAFASNVGGTATLIGDPPNIMIGSYAHLSFMDFAHNLTVVCALALIFSIVYFCFWFRKEYRKAEVKDVPAMIAYLREQYRITDRRLLMLGSTVLGLTVFLFLIHGMLKMEPSIAALIGAAVLVVISRADIVEMLEKEVEWSTLIFFMMLFIVVAGAEQAGLIQIIADWVKYVSRGSLVIAILTILWVSALASAIIDNIPFTATMLPIVAYLNSVIPGAESGVLWWALSLGACLGGNGTMIGASANVVTVGMADKAGYPVSFMEYFKIAFIPMIITVLICSAWLLLVEI